MKNSLSENMLRFGTKNLSETAKQQLAYLNEQDPKLKNATKMGVNYNLFKQLTLTVPIGKPDGDFKGFANQVVPGQKGNFVITMLDNWKISDNPLDRFYRQYKKYPVIDSIKVGGYPISQKGGVNIESVTGGKITGTFALLNYEAYKANKASKRDNFKYINTILNTAAFTNPSVATKNPTEDQPGASVIFVEWGPVGAEGPTFFNKLQGEQFQQSPEYLQIKTIAI